MNPSPPTSPLRVCIDARLEGAGHGGTGTVALGLARALSRLAGGDEEYLFLTWAGDDAWLRPHVSGPCRILPGPRAPAEPAWKRWARERLPAVRDAWHRLIPRAGTWAAPIPDSDGTAERAGAHVMHFILENAFRTALPSIYHPWDLQHLHFPQYFTRRHWMIRERRYRFFCGQARLVAVSSSWVREDLAARYGLPREKIRVTPLAPILDDLPPADAAAREAVRRTFALPEAFAYYPAQTWPHKNHLGLLDAIAILRDQHGLDVPLVCSGAQREFFPVLQARARALRLGDRVRFTGFVPPAQLRALYAMCRCVVIPTFFEAASFPLWEAFQAGAPAACAAVTSLPRQGGDAALYFDPHRPDQIADAVRRIWTDPVLREALVRRGRERIRDLSWDRTARTFRALYREVAGRPLTDEDRTLRAAEAEL